MSAIPFFALAEDLKAALLRVEAVHPITYALSGIFDEPRLRKWESVTGVPSFGVATTGDTIKEPTYLLADSRSPIQFREVPQHRGGLRYALDRRSNPHAFGICPGGYYSPGIVIAGQIGVSPVPTEMEVLFLQSFRRAFSRVGSYHVGPTAMRALREGARLTVNHEASTEYDLKP